MNNSPHSIQTILHYFNKHRLIQFLFVCFPVFRCEIDREGPWHAYVLLRAEAWASHDQKSDEKKCGIRAVITKTGQWAISLFIVESSAPCCITGEENAHPRRNQHRVATRLPLANEEPAFSPPQRREGPTRALSPFTLCTQRRPSASAASASASGPGRPPLLLPKPGPARVLPARVAAAMRHTRTAFSALIYCQNCHFVMLLHHTIARPLWAGACGDLAPALLSPPLPLLSQPQPSQPQSIHQHPYARSPRGRLC